MHHLNWLGWLLVAWILLGILLRIAFIGKARKPMTPGAVVAGTIESLIVIGLILFFWPVS